MVSFANSKRGLMSCRSRRSRQSYEGPYAEAIYTKNSVAIRSLIIESPKLLDILASEIEPSKSAPYVNVFYALVENTPDLAEEALNEILVRSDSCGQFNTHTLDLTFLHNVYIPNDKIPHNTEDKTHRKAFYMKPYSTDLYLMIEKSVLTLMMRNGNENLLKHPVVSTMIGHKWRKFGRWRFFIGFVAQLLFVALLMSAVLLQPHPSVMKQANELLENTEDDDDCTNLNKSCCIAYHEIYVSGNYEGFIVVEGIVTALVIINLLDEISRFVRFRKYFITNLEDLVSTATNVLILCLLVNIKSETVPRDCLPDISPSASTKVVVQEFWQWQTGTVGVMLAWISLIFYVRKLPHSGIYVIMFFDVARTFLRFSSIFVLFLFSFASAFYMLFPHNQCPFDNMFTTLIKTFTMTIGEFEFGDIVCGRKLTSPYITWAVVWVFAFVMALVMMNLMIGLAVQDIKSIYDKATLKKLCLRASIVLQSELSMPYVFRKYVMEFEDTATCDELECDLRIQEEEDLKVKQEKCEDLEKLVAEMNSMRQELASFKELFITNQNSTNVSYVRM